MAERHHLRPRVGTVIGDPCGIGPEVVAKAWATGQVHLCSRPVLIGSAAAMEQAIRITGIDAKLHKVAALSELSDDPRVVDIIDTGWLDANEITPGKSNRACGYATAMWLDQSGELAKAGQLAAVVYAPIDSAAMKMAGVLDRVVSIKPGENYALLLSGPLRVAHVTDHLPMRQMCDELSAELIEAALITLHTELQKWGMADPRIVVAGLNPHAQGREEDEAIGPGIARARLRGVAADGPQSPDSVFRHCIEGRYDVVLAMYHDQGHIAVKTWGFSGNCVLVLGAPHINLSVAHGTAHDIVGKGIADPAMILSAMTTGAFLAAGRGFPNEQG